jgi:hypothetical protein
MARIDVGCAPGSRRQNTAWAILDAAFSAFIERGFAETSTLRSRRARLKARALRAGWQ